MPYWLSEPWFQGRGIPLGPELLSRWFRYFARPAVILRSYRLADLRPDLVAGLTVAMVALPQAIAYASIANLPPHYGLYSAIVAAIVGSLWGSSSHLATGPTNAASILMLSILAPLVALDSHEFLIASSIMAVLVGVFRILFGMAGLGVLVNFVSRSVLLGFTAGAGTLIAINQLPHVFGISVPVGTGPWATLSLMARQLPTAHGVTTTIALATVLVTLVVNRLFRKLPGSLVALAGATAVVAWLGADALDVRVVGTIPSAVPRPLDLSTAWSLAERGIVGKMLVGALAISLLGLVEAVSIARAIARTTGERLDVNQEFVGQGLANVATGFLSGYPCSGSFTRSAVAHQAGGRTHLSGVLTGIIVLGFSLLLAPHLAFLPRSSLAGVIVLVAYGMIDKQSLARVLRTSRSESAIMVSTFLATLLFPLEFAVLSGVIFSLSTYVYRSSVPRVRAVVPDRTFRHFVEEPGAPTCPQLSVVNIRGALFFGATQHVEETLLRDLAEPEERRYLLLRMHGVDQCDFTGLEMLEGIVSAYRQQGGDVFMVQVRPAVRVIMYESGFKGFLGEDHFPAQEQAIDRLFETVIDPAICCYRCPHRVFAECQALPKYPRDVALPPHRFVPIDPTRRLGLAGVDDLLKRRAPVVLDVREREEYLAGHLSEARSLPLHRLISEADRLPRDRPLLLICRSGRRSERAMRILLDLGFEDVQNLRGGILSWKAADRPLEVE